MNTLRKIAPDIKHEIEAAYKLRELKKVITESNKPAKTNLLKNIKFKSKEDEYVFNMLPLSDFDKEQMLMEMYNINNLCCK